MAYYIKANYLVAQYLGVADKRVQFPDGHYLLWQGDVARFDNLIYLDSICARIGAVKLTPQQAKAEQQGKTCRSLPTATEDRFVLPSSTDESTDSTVSDESESSNEGEDEG